MRRVHVAVPVRADQQQALDRVLGQHQIDKADGILADCKAIEEHRPPAFGEATAATPPRSPLQPRLRGQRIPASGGAPSSAANSGSTAASRPAPGPAAAMILIRSRASSSSGSASSSRPSARNA